MPDDYNIPYQTIRELLAAVRQPSPIKHRHIYMGDDVYSEHVMDLVRICYTLWNYINTELGDPYTKDYDFQPLRSLLLSIPTLRFGSPLTPFEWNSIFDFCRRIIDLILRYPPLPPYRYIWQIGNELYSGVPPDDLHLIDTITIYYYIIRTNCCWYLYGRYWAVYCNPDTGNICIKTSTDLKTWSNPMIVDSNCQSFEDSILVGNILYVVGKKSNNFYLYKVELHEDGTISVTVQFNFGCSQYPTYTLGICAIGIRGNEMWFYYTVYNPRLMVDMVYRRVSYYPFNQIGSETYVVFYGGVPEIKMINGTDYLFVFLRFAHRPTFYIRPYRYDGENWISDNITSMTLNFFPFKWNNTIYYLNLAELFGVIVVELVYWDGSNWETIDYSGYFQYPPITGAVWVTSPEKTECTISQYDPETWKYRVQYFEIKSDLSLELKEATDWIDIEINPYTVIDRKNSL